MSMYMKPLSSNNYQVKQSDDDMQRHNAIRHHREGSGQDRYGQEAFRDEGVAVLYTIDGQKMQGDRRYYRLQSVKPYGPRDGQWVQMKEVRHVKTTPWDFGDISPYTLNFSQSEQMDPKLPRTTRKVPMQVLALGLPRTGTASMRAALQALGYNETAHGFDIVSHPEIGAPWMDAVNAKFLGKGKPYGRAEFDALLGHCAAVTDFPCACFWEELMAAYPKAKIILVERDVEDWYKSFDETVVTELFSKVADVIVDYVEPLIGSQVGPMSRKIIYGYFHAKTPDEVLQNAREVYREHYRRIREATPKERLLEYRLGEGWGPLCDFLGKDVPDGLPFPRINEAAALKAKIREVQWEKFKAAGVAMGRYIVPIVVVGIAMWYWYRR